MSPTLIWFLLVDSTGQAFKGTFVTSILSSALAVPIVDQFRKAVKTEYNQPNFLKDIPPGVLQVYKNKAAFESKTSFQSSCSVLGLGKDEEDALIVLVPLLQHKIKKEMEHVRNDETDIVISAFSTNFTNSDQPSRALYTALGNLAAQWNPDVYYFPGTSIIQASGMGKSRAITDLANYNVFVFYCSFMSKISTGFPKKTPIADFLSSGTVDVFKGYFIACLTYLNGWLDRNQADSKKFLIEQKIMNTDGDNQFWKDISQIMATSEREFMPDKLKNVCSLSTKSGKSSRLCIVFAFDEVRELITCPLTQSGFSNLRRAAKIIPCKLGIAVAVMDTTSRISNMVPPKGKFPSDKVVIENKYLFDPIYLLPSMDIGAINPINKELDTVLSLNVIYRYGRPMWAAYLENQFDIESLRRLALYKLLGGGSDSDRLISDLFNFNNGKKLHRLDALAMLRTRLPFQVLRSDFSVELVASRMHVCLYISPDRESVVSGLGSEPLLADAVATVVRKGRLWTHVIAHYVDAISIWAVDKGLNGELVAALLLLIARDLSLTPDNCLANQPVDLKMLFQTLFNNETYLALEKASQELVQLEEKANPQKESPRKKLKTQKKADSRNPFEVGKVSFTHFVRIVGTPTKNQMILYYARGAAILCENGEEAVDIVIPVLMPDNSHRYVLSSKNLTYVCIQVKNWKKGGRPSNWPKLTEQNDPWYTKHFKVNLLLQLGGPKKDLEIISDSSDISFCVYGLDEEQFSFLSKEDLYRESDRTITKQLLDGIPDLSEPPTVNNHFNLVYLLRQLLGKEINELHRNETDRKIAKTLCPGVYVDALTIPTN